MITDQEIARGVESLLSQSNPNAITSLNGFVNQLEANLGHDLTHKATFIRDHLTLLLNQKDLFTPQFTQFQQYPHLQFAQNHPHFALHQQQQQQLYQQQLQNLSSRQHPVARAETVETSTVVQKRETNVAPVKTKESAPTGTKRKGGAGGLNKVCGVSPVLQAIVGEPKLSRTEIVKALWAYIRKNNLQDPSNKRKIICNDELRLVFETDETDMFNMNKLLSKHILPLGPEKETSQAKKSKVEVESSPGSSVSGPPTVIISEALAKFLGTKDREMLQIEVMRRVWDYIKVNKLEDPLNSMAVLCDEKLRELVGCESISSLGMSEMLVSRHMSRH